MLICWRQSSRWLIKKGPLLEAKGLFMSLKTGFYREVSATLPFPFQGSFKLYDRPGLPCKTT